MSERRKKVGGRWGGSCVRNRNFDVTKRVIGYEVLSWWGGAANAVVGVIA